MMKTIASRMCRAAARCAALALAMLSVAALSAEPAWAKRVAIVIGNSNYEHVGALRNPGNDADDLARVLERLDFEVEVAHDLDKPAFELALRDFSRAADAAEVAVLFFAGHGVSVGGRSWLLPVSSRLDRESDVDFEAISIDLAMSAVQGATHLRLVILDACRDNPFTARMAPRRGATRSVGRGLSRIEPSGDTLVWYAARDGFVAADGMGRNSPFTQALLSNIETPGLELDKLFREIVSDVRQTTGGAQEPFRYGSRGEQDFFFSPAKALERVETISQEEGGAPVSGGCAPSVAENAALQEAIAANDLVALEAFLRAFPNSCLKDEAEGYAAFLRARAAAGEQAAAAAAEQARQEALAAQSAEESEWLALSGGENIEGVRAFLTRYPNGRFAVAARERLTELHKLGQIELRRLGLYRAGIDGDWGVGSSGALRSFQQRKGLSTVDGVLTETLLNLLRAEPTPPPSAVVERPSGSASAQAAAPVNARSLGAAWWRDRCAGAIDPRLIALTIGRSGSQPGVFLAPNIPQWVLDNVAQASESVRGHRIYAVLSASDGDSEGASGLYLVEGGIIYEMTIGFERFYPWSEFCRRPFRRDGSVSIRMAGHDVSFGDGRRDTIYSALKNLYDAIRG